MNVLRTRCIAGKLRLSTESQSIGQQDDLAVLGSSFVRATPWKLCVLILLLILTLKRMVSLLEAKPGVLGQ